MSTTRTVTLKLTTQRDLMRFQTSASTFGELKSELINQVQWDGMKVIERTNRVTLESPDAVLPTEDFMLFLVPQKVKSGTNHALVQKIREARQEINTILLDLEADVISDRITEMPFKMNELDHELEELRKQLGS